MSIVRLNHAVLHVRDLDRSLAFYRDLMGFRVLPGTPRALRFRAAFLQAPGSTNDHDLALFELGPDAGAVTEGTVGLVHLAWEVDTLAELERLAGVLQAAGAFVRSSDHGATKSVYGRDPDGIEFEVTWMVPRLYWGEWANHGVVRPLDLDLELQRWGRPVARA